MGWISFLLSFFNFPNKRYVDVRVIPAGALLWYSHIPKFYLEGKDLNIIK